MAPPGYGDIGKSSRNLFNKHYHVGNVKFDLKSQSPSGVEFVLDGFGNIDTKKSVTAFETKYNVKPHGVTLKQKWTTENVWSAEATAEDQFVKGLKGGVQATFAPQSGRKSGQLSCGFKSNLVNVNGNVDLDYSGLTSINGSGVVGHCGWLAGMKIIYDPVKNKLSKTHFALGYQLNDIHLTGNLNDGQDYSCSVYQNWQNRIETGINVGYTPGNNSSSFGLGGAYKVEDGLTLKAKANNNSQISVCIIKRIRPGFNASATFHVDAYKNHGQVGVGFDLGAQD